MSQQTPEQTPPQAPAANQPPPAPEAGKQPPWGDKPENFNADQAWELIQKLRTEKTDPQLRSEFDALKQSQQAQRDALASALGLKPEETSDTDKLAGQVSTLREQIIASERRALAAEHKIPDEFQHMLTATDTEGLKKQAADLVRFAEAAFHAASTTQPPAFQPNPGQGQGNAPLTPEAQAAAEYEKYYPSK